MKKQAAIRTESLTKLYGRIPALNPLDLTIEQGEVFGYLGPNGAGKSTTIRILLDLIRPTAGRATVLGHDCQRNSHLVRRQVGYLPGEYTLYENLSGRELIQYIGALRGRLDWSRVHDLAERLGSDLSQGIGTLSHGNKQKIGLILAFMDQPPLLILDEPTIGLDPLVQREFYDLIAEVKANGQTVFFSSHILPEVERICDRVGIVRRGDLVKVESVSAIKQKSLRHVEMTFGEPIAPEPFEVLPGVRDLVLEDRRLRCTVQGSLEALIKTAAPLGVTDLISHEPELEEIFMELYGGENGAA